MRNVKYINSYANKEHHEQFNAILLFALNSYFRVKMYSGKDSKNNMYRTLREKGYKIRNIDNQNLLILKGKSGIPNFIRFLFSALYNTHEKAHPASRPVRRTRGICDDALRREGLRGYSPRGNPDEPRRSA